MGLVAKPYRAWEIPSEVAWEHAAAALLKSMFVKF